MSQKKYRQPLDLNPHASTRLLILLLVVHLLALSSLVLPLTLPGYWRVIILFAIAISAWSCFYKKNFNKIKKACWRINGDIDLERANGKRMRATLLADSIVTEWIVILHLASCTGRKYTWLILPDMIDRETYRRLCVRLRQWHVQGDKPLRYPAQQDN